MDHDVDHDELQLGETVPLVDHGDAEQRPSNPRAASFGPDLRHTEAAFGDYGAVPAELGRVVTLTLPLSLQYVFTYSSGLISMAFVGRLGSFQLSVAVLANSLFNVSGLSLVVGMSSAMETLAGQAFGAANYSSIGVILQRALLVNGAVGLVVLGLWTQLRPILSLLGQDADISAACARYLHLSVPALFCLGVSEPLKRYLMAQRNVMPATVSTIITTLLAPLWNWLFIYGLGFGLHGAAIANDAVQFSNAVLLLVYVAHRERRLHGTPESAWRGWSRRCLTAWSQYLQIALPSLCMVCLEWWTFEVMILLAGLLPNPSISVSVMGISFNTSAFCYVLAMAFGGAASTRVANELGAGDWRAARLAAVVALTLALAMLSMLGISVAIARHHIAQLITNSPEVIQAAGLVMPIVAFALIGDGLNAAFAGVLRGCGQQFIGAVVNVTVYWVFGIPLAAILAFSVHQGVRGLLLGLMSTTTLQALVMTVVIYRFDWPKLADAAASLIKAHAYVPDHLAELTTIPVSAVAVGEAQQHGTAAGGFELA